jgi:pyridoxamine 5'-phosphate oxidase
VLSDRDQLLGRLASAEERFAGCGVPRPPQWGGFLVRPAEIELWQGRPARLHERWRYRYVSGGWVAELLSP